MARGKRNGRPSRQRRQEQQVLAAQKEAERRERILADRRRTDAKWRPKIPEVRRCNFENFKNRFHDVDKQDYAIEVLMGGAGLQGQIRREQAARRKEELARIRQGYLRAWGEACPEQVRVPQTKREVEERARRQKREDAAQANETEISRIRIQSQPVLGHLTSLLNDTEQRSTPRTFMRPFKSLVHFQPKMKEVLATLEEKWADFEELDETESGGVGGTPEELEIVEEESAKEKNSDSQSKEDDDDDDDNQSLFSVDSNAEDLDGIMDSVEALHDMRCYVNFVDREVMPLYSRYNDTAADRVKFDDLWSLFRVGDLIYMPAGGETAGRYHEVWRIYRTELPEPEVSYPTSGAWEFFADEMQQQDKKAKFTIFAYYIDHDGNNYGAVRHKFELDSFPGERLVESLEVFPVRYRHDHHQLLESLKKQGREFQRFLTDRHQAYNAWTLTRNPPYDTKHAEEEILRDEHGEKMRHPEFVESDVIVDLAEAYQKNPDWRPCFHRLTANKGGRIETEDDDMKIQSTLR